MKTFTHTEQSIIADVVSFERSFKVELPNNSFYKSIALSAAKRLGFTWKELMELFS